MIQKILLTVALCLAQASFAQQIKVKLTEKKNGKRLVLIAENTTKDTLNVFLMVTSEGYRRSASRPVIKNIPPQSKIPMITMIEITGQQQSYTYDLIVNEEENHLSLNFDDKPKDIEQLIKNKLVLFTKTACKKCDDLKKALTEERITYQSFSLDNDPLIYRQFMALIEKDFTLETRIRFPIIWNKDQVLFSYEELNEMVIRLGGQ